MRVQTSGSSQHECAVYNCKYHVVEVEPMGLCVHDTSHTSRRAHINYYSFLNMDWYWYNVYVNRLEPSFDGVGLEHGTQC